MKNLEDGLENFNVDTSKKKIHKYAEYDFVNRHGNVLIDKLDELGDKFKDSYNKFKDGIANTKDDFVNLLRYTKIEIGLFAVAGLISIGAWSYANETKQNRCLRLAFSETSQIERQAEKLGVDVPHLTDFLSKYNDFYMKIFESYNDSWTDIPFVKDNIKTFATTLNYHVDPSFKFHHYELPQLAVIVPQFADSTLKDFSYLKKMADRTDIAVQTLKDTWDDSHHDKTHIEIYYTTETSTDSQGHTHTETVMHTRTEYDWTDNKYVYFPIKGEQSYMILNGIQIDFPKVKTENLFMPALKTEAENEYAIEKSRKSDLKGKTLSPEEYLELANNWLFGSRYFVELKRMEELRAELSAETDVWKINKTTAKSYEERTYNHSHAESPEFLTSQNAISTGIGLSGLTNASLNSIEDAKRRIPILFNSINTYIAKASEQETKISELRELKEDIMSQTFEGYELLFPQLNLEHSKYWHVPLYALVGALIGGLIGAGIDFAGEKTNLYGKRIEYNKRKKFDY